jgi:hypothetical protein
MRRKSAGASLNSGATRRAVRSHRVRLWMAPCDSLGQPACADHVAHLLQQLGRVAPQVGKRKVFGHRQRAILARAA